MSTSPDLACDLFSLNSLIQGVLQLHSEVHRAPVCRSREVPSQSCAVPLNPMAHTGRGHQTTADMVSPLNIPFSLPVSLTYGTQLEFLVSFKMCG